MSIPILTVPEVLHRAAALIDDRGLAREFYECCGELCALGAIAVALDLPPQVWIKEELTEDEAARFAVADEARNVMNRYVGKHTRFRGVVRFNDSAKADTVTAALRAAAAEEVAA